MNSQGYFLLFLCGAEYVCVANTLYIELRCIIMPIKKRVPDNVSETLEILVVAGTGFEPVTFGL